MFAQSWAQDPAWQQVDAAKACPVLEIKGASGQLLDAEKT